MTVETRRETTGLLSTGGGSLTPDAPPVGGDESWSLTFASILVVIDCLAIFMGLIAAYEVRFHGVSGSQVHGISYVLLLTIAGPAWLGALVLNRSYDLRMLGAGPAEFRRVALGSTRLFALTAVVCFAFKFQMSRIFLGTAWVIGTTLLLIARYAARKWLHRQRANGGWCHRLLVIGDNERIDELAGILAREPFAGYAVVGACTPESAAGEATPGGVPMFGSLTGAVGAARAAGCGTIAITASPGITAHTLRRLAWDLEGTDISLVVAPALTDVAGPRISIHPVAGLPLLHVDQPELGVVHRSVKRTMDVLVSALALVLLSPLLLAIAVGVKLTSRGPVVFKQTRVGRDSSEFCAYKFRSMRVDAEDQLDELRALNEAAGLLFKMRDDPRVTRVGRLLRRYSLDELPQLVNVLRGEMSLVGPRPPLPDEVEQYAEDVRRRLLVKPGITGLWQVSGRTDLSWEDSVRLDLYYVENWSLGLDLQIIARTILAVLRAQGAY